MFEDIILQLRQARYRDGVKERDHLLYDFGRCENTTGMWLKACELVQSQILNNTLCLCEKEVSDIYYGAKQYLGLDCEAPVQDFTSEDRPDRLQWIIQNPLCVVYDFWVDAIKAQCALVGIDIKVRESECAVLGLNVKAVYQEVCNELELRFLVEEIKCDLGLNVSLTEIEKCKVDFDIKIVPLGCDVDFNVVAKAVACGIDINVIASELACGMTLNVTAEGVEFCPPLSQEVTITQMDFNVVADDITVCYYRPTILSLEDVTHPLAEYIWDFGVNAVFSSTVGAGPHTVYWTTSGVKTITVTGLAGDQEEVRTLHVTVSNCPGNIAGAITNIFGGAMQSVNVRLYLDDDLDGVADNSTIIKSSNSSSGGTWSMTNLTPGNYVIVVSPVNGYTLLLGVDPTDDSDIVLNIDATDNVIPVTVLPSEIDANNNFIFIPNAGIIYGNVSDDIGNPIEGAVVNVYNDDDKDGISDGTLAGSGVTDIDGNYSIEDLYTANDISVLTAPKSHYVIILEVPDGYTIVSGIDASEDLDTVPNTDTSNNIIPCTLSPGESDEGNNFIIQLIP